jgi:hypothetical protein
MKAHAEPYAARVPANGRSLIVSLFPVHPLHWIGRLFLIYGAIGIVTSATVAGLVLIPGSPVAKLLAMPEHPPTPAQAQPIEKPAQADDPSLIQPASQDSPALIAGESSNPAQVAAALKEIRKTASEICSAQQQANQNQKQSADLQAKLTDVIAKLTELGATAMGQISKNEQVWHEQLAYTSTHSADCKMEVFNQLVEKILPTHPQSVPAAARPTTDP